LIACARPSGPDITAGGPSRHKREYTSTPDDWWFSGVPVNVRKKVRERIEEAQGKTGRAEENFDLVDYRAIIQHPTNWPLFKDVLCKDGGKDKGTKWIVDVNEIRKVVMHASRGLHLPVKPEQVAYLENHLDWLPQIGALAADRKVVMQTSGEGKVDSDSAAADRLQLRWPVWIGVVGEDLETQRRFYRDVLGLSELKAGDDWVWFDFEGKLLELLAKSPLPQYDRRRVSFAFDVDDIQSARSILIERGVEPVTEIEGGPESLQY
jgi:hypothetical protein